MSKGHMLEHFLDIFYPKHCHACGSVLQCGTRERKEYLSIDGEKVESPYCRECTEYLQMIFTPTHLQSLRDCECVFLWNYNDKTVQKLLWHVKLKKCKACHRFFGETAAAATRRIFPSSYAVTYIPRSVPLMKKLGFDQSLEILKAFIDYQKRESSLRFAEMFYRDEHHSNEQKSLNQFERVKNARLSLRLRTDTVPLDKILVIDDMITTGATADVAYTLLKKAGARRVYFMSVAWNPNYLKWKKR